MDGGESFAIAHGVRTNFDRDTVRAVRIRLHHFKHSPDSGQFMLEEFCEGNHCDQYIPPEGGSFAQCLMMQRELSRVGSCPLRYDAVVAKAGPASGPVPHSEARGEHGRKKGSRPRAK